VVVSGADVVVAEVASGAVVVSVPVAGESPPHAAMRTVNPATSR
jgi:hypothetical protein